MPGAHRRSAVGLAAAVLAWCQTAGPHPQYRAAIQHQVLLRVGRETIDVTVRLTYYEIPSLAERRRMDADGDGRIGAGEIDAYLDEIALELDGCFALRLEHRPLDLIPLYRPEIDLLGEPHVAEAHHALTLTLFARLPPDLRTACEGLFEDLSYPHTPALVRISGEIEEGLAIDVESPPAGAPPQPDSSRRARLVWREPPGDRFPWPAAAAAAGAVGAAALLLCRWHRRRKTRDGSPPT